MVCDKSPDSTGQPLVRAAPLADDTAADDSGCLDEGLFRHFAPLLRVSQPYASQSGCRFRHASFDGLADIGTSCTSEDVQRPRRVASPRLAAKLGAAPAVSAFAARLREGEEGLVEEVERAHRVVMAESVRNAMKGMFQSMEMFPPKTPPPEVYDTDCTFEDVYAPLLVVAQRLYNDEVRRLMDGSQRLYRRAVTAAFLVDFAECAGMALPPVPETYMSMLQEVSTRVADELERSGADRAAQQGARTAFLQGLGRGAASDALRQEVKKWWAGRWPSVLLASAVGTAALLGARAMAAQRGRAQA
mmetsp:Transcript_195/g.742  ORF Transcript_195/g.742 Transcript_195/m.742 type:complete len:303 (+) Transcript_195:82-990(+)